MADADYGVDVAWANGDLKYGLPEMTGRLLLLNDLAKRYETATGQMGWDPLEPDYGYDLRNLLNTKVRGTTFSSEESRIEAEALKDDRVLRASAKVTFEGDVLVVRLKVVDASGPFDMTFRVAANLPIEALLAGP